ncbi:alginate lyase [Psychromonas sp. psych-6C06]|uniref:polysaccharide lyase 6 family protein n=1 Tax=Psychromonas sp. psych-6C06 TaxID=2058089 RepID=UPI000C31E79A|nr:polysaccharide lyase 6 family protein [Psychromonas sp. psych-6C06]PKF60561.1 alginate lyase [Psychromonas sp. psych-6C06]
MKKLSFIAIAAMLSQPLMALTHSDLLDNKRLTPIVASSVNATQSKQVENLKEQLQTLKSGDTLILSPGRYQDLGIVEINADNITIKAEKPGQAWLTGLVQLVVKSNNVVIDGLVFTEGGPAERFGALRLEGDNNVLKNTTFKDFNHDYAYQPDERRQEYPKYLWISLWGKNAQLINNRFEAKYKRGTLIGVQKDETADNHIIKHNLFYSQKPNQYNEFAIKEAIRYNGNSWEAIRVGDSKASQFPSKTLIEENLFVDMDGEREMISLKSGENIIRGNTIFNSASMISLRHGKANIVENNVILGNNKQLTGGMRIYDEDHVIRNNYIAGTRGSEGDIKGNADVRGGIVLNTGIIDVANGEKLDQSVKGKELNKQWTPKNITITNNTIYDADWGIVHGSQGHRVSLFDNKQVENIYGGVDIHFADNFVMTTNEQQVAVRASEQFPLQKATYQNERYIGQLIEAKQLNNYSLATQGVKEKNSFFYLPQQGADVNQLKIMTTETVGPNYIIK